MIFPISPHRDVLTQHPHPPTEVTQSQSEDFKFSGVIPDQIEFKLIRFLRIPRRGGKGIQEEREQAPRTEPSPRSFWILRGILPHRTNQQPPASDLGIIPSRHNIRTGPQNQIQLILEYRRKSLDPEN